ncbi:MAG TPA: cyanophycinase [Actinomycetota bacterium]|nr:cyanophycinase [Actinomycetota bacterium]
MRTPRPIALLLTSLLVGGLLVSSAGTAASTERRGHGYRSWLRGSPIDVHPATRGGAMLAGGAYDRATAWRWFLEHAGYGDIVIVCATCDAVYNPYVFNLHEVDSAQTLKLTKRVAASDPFVLASLTGADGIFIAGGDQSDYLRVWKDSPVEDAINDAIARGVPIGGISAGLAIQGEFLFSAEKNTITSDRALLNPYNNKVTVRRDMLRVPHLAATITDSHFSERRRQGRLLTFMARTIADGWTDQVRGIGVDEATAVLLEADGTARVVGPGAGWFLRMREADVLTCADGQPLETRAIDIVGVHRGDVFDLTSWSGNGERRTIRAADGAVVWDRSPTPAETDP